MTSTTGKNDDGFTLVELIVVLAILVLALAVLLPNFRESFRHYRLTSLLGEMEKNIRYAQYHAVMEGRRYAMRYDNTSKTYRFLREKRAGDRVDWLPLEGAWGREKKLSHNLSLWFRGKDKVYFLPDGSVTETDILIRNQAQTEATLRLGRSLRGVEVDRKGAGRVA